MDPARWVEAQLPRRGLSTFIETHQGRRLSYQDMHELSGRYAAALAQLGVKIGDRVAVQVDKSVEAIALYLACLRSGSIFVPLNTAYKLAELEHILLDSRPSLFIARPQDYEAATEVAERAKVGIVETLGGSSDGTLPALARALAASSLPSARLQPEELAAIIYTSGTTGRPKGAMLTRGNLYENAMALAQVWQFTSDDVLLHALPLFHAHGMFIAVNTVLASGASMHMLDKFDADHVIALLPKCTVLMGVPTFYSRLLAHSDLDRKAAENVRLFISGSAPLLRETHAAFEERTGHFILERYGMSETLILSAVPAEGKRVRGSVGPALPGVELRIVDKETGAPIGDPSAIGLIQVRGPQILGYWQNPEHTAREFSKDGYFSTGDLGGIDQDGNLYIVGRLKDLVITGGYNVYPKEVESEIDRVPGVVESAVFGVPHPDFGEGVTAAVVLSENANLDEGTILRSISGRLANYKLPKRVVIVDELPRNALGKVQKNALRTRYADLYGARAVGGQGEACQTLARLEVKESIATITMLHEAKRNALSRALLDDLSTKIDRATESGARVVILRARAGAAVWSAGHDIAEIPPPGVDPLEWDAPLRQFIRKIAELPVPVIAMIQGGVWGGACEVVLTCDLAVATPESTMAMTPARLGVPYNLSGMLNVLNSMNPKLVREMLFAAKPISAARLADSGVINQLASPAELEAVTWGIAQDIAANSPLAIRVMREQLRHLASARPMSPEAFERIQGLRKSVYSSRDYSEGIRAFNEKRKPEFRGE